MNKPQKHTLKWFVSRIGKDIYRNDCGNRTVTVAGLTHARYLKEKQDEFDLYYSDKPFK